MLRALFSGLLLKEEGLPAGEGEGAKHSYTARLCVEKGRALKGWLAAFRPSLG